MVKVGIIGTGIIAREHAAAIASVADSVQLVAAADVAAGPLADFCDTYGVERRYGSIAQLVADPQVDLVAIATPPSSHEEAVIAALEAGKYVLCEKPLAQSMAAAMRIAEAAAKYPGRLSVSHQLRYAPQYRRMLWLIRKGYIGELKSASVERHGYIPHTTVGKGGWWGAWGVAGGGVLMTQMIHEVDIMLEAMGEPVAVTASMDTRYTTIESEDWIEADVQFDGGRTARLASSVNSGQMRGGLTITGSKGSIGPGRISLNSPADEARAIAAVNSALPDTRPASVSLPSRVVRKLASKFGGKAKPDFAAHALLYRDIAKAIGAGKALPIPAEEAIRSLQLCAAAYEAGATGETVKLPLTRSSKSFEGMTSDIYSARPRVDAAKLEIAPTAKAKVVRIGLIGLDTTHATTFADLLHNPYNGDHIAGGRVVAAFAGGSPDMGVSASRVGGFTAELRDKYGVPMLDTPEAVADACDVVMILSCDGRTHPGLFRSVAGRGKPVFIDKPMAISLADADNIVAIAKATKTRIFASSAFRYADALVKALNEIRASGQKIETCRVRYWGQIQPTQGRYFWYGIHGAEMLLAVMGKGVKAVTATTQGSVDTIEVEHADGRRSTLIGDQNDGTFHVSITTDQRTYDLDIGGAISARMLATVLDVLTPGGYPRLWSASDHGSVSGRQGKGVDPDIAETLEVIGLLDAAQRSQKSGQKTEL